MLRDAEAEERKGKKKGPVTGASRTQRLGLGVIHLREQSTQTHRHRHRAQSTYIGRIWNIKKPKFGEVDLRNGSKVEKGRKVESNEKKKNKKSGK